MVSFNIGEYKVNFGGVPFVVIIYLVGVGIYWWHFSWWIGFIAVVLDLII